MKTKERTNFDFKYTAPGRQDGSSSSTTNESKSSFKNKTTACAQAAEEEEAREEERVVDVRFVRQEPGEHFRQPVWRTFRQVLNEGRKASTDALLTSSPYKDSLANDLSKAQKTNGKGAKILQRKCVGNVATKCFENKENEAPAEKESESQTMKSKWTKKRLERTKKQLVTSSDSDIDIAGDLTVSTDDEDSEDNCECPYCNETYLSDRAGENMILKTLNGKYEEVDSNDVADTLGGKTQDIVWMCGLVAKHRKDLPASSLRFKDWRRWRLLA
ncbi:unnamed protein product [Acanthoscelides obtectus]|uniref:Uncharacterized protein n=1 Tax=Acanthoscelides obtectus TaxID=200917 RepID=A0A9P0MAT8_ACAOB|nr:unnamed protein product [Acanthoscelides obtectus]CAK1623924.1 hypothetical protein AOBTE_LOCUS2234 [Acanthoscelides obtectus]